MSLSEEDRRLSSLQVLQPTEVTDQHEIYVGLPMSDQRRMLLANLVGRTTVVSLVNGVAVTADSFLVDTYGRLTWELTLSNGALRQSWTIDAYHDGTTASDATATVETIYGAGPDSPSHLITTDLIGSGTTQEMRLRITAPAAGWTSTVRRTIAHPAGAS